MRTSAAHQSSNHREAPAPIIDESLVRALVSAQFPQWAHLTVGRVANDGWDNRSFRLGDELVVRMPSAEAYAAQVEKEHHWLPILADSLSYPIPRPLALGVPAGGYPWPWSIYRWVDGETVAPESVADSPIFAANVAAFLVELQNADATGGPPPGSHNFFRGGPLSIYDVEVREAVQRLGAQIDTHSAIDAWDSAQRTSWSRAPVWVHGDMCIGNLLSHDGRLTGVLDFGASGVGDPACDLSIAWTLFRGNARQVFRDGIPMDPATWQRARAWALWKGLIVAAGLGETNAVEWRNPIGAVDALLKEKH